MTIRAFRLFPRVADILGMLEIQSRDTARQLRKILGWSLRDDQMTGGTGGGDLAPVVTFHISTVTAETAVIDKVTQVILSRAIVSLHLREEVLGVDRLECFGGSADLRGM